MESQSQKTSDPLAAFRTEMYARLKRALDTPTPASEEVERMLADLNQAGTSLDPTSIEEVRTALENIRRQQHEQFGIQLAEALCEAAVSLGIMIRPTKKPSQTGSSGSRQRYTSDQRHQITQKVIAAIQSGSDDGMSKAEIAKQLSLTTNQIKRILQWPEVQSQIVGVGAARNRRYALKTLSPKSNQVDE